MPKRPRHEILHEAHMRSQGWLTRLERLEETGVTGGPEHDEAARMSEYWMHRYAALSGKRDA